MRKKTPPDPSGQTVAVIAAHPDDEILGVGGTIRRHVLAGDTVHVIVVCEGETMRYHGRSVNLRKHSEAACRRLGTDRPDHLGLPDQRLDTLSLIDVIRPLEARLKRLQPHRVYTHYYGDVNRDHQIVAEAVAVACRPLGKIIETLLAFETPSATEWGVPYTFAPNYFVDITTTLPDKLGAMACYATEVGAYPHPRSLRHLEERARSWGAWAGTEAAEAFVLLRQTWR
jgi:LmbE family N-acetylglucosaminyl deacetylase